MARINMVKREIIYKIIYYGAAYSGKTTNLMYLHNTFQAGQVSEIISTDSDVERSLHFEMVPQAESPYTLRMQVYVAPGEIAQHKRLAILKEMDSLIFVVDSSASRLANNRACLEEMLEELTRRGKNLQEFPVAIQWNKRDLPDALPVPVLEEQLNPLHFPAVEAAAINGTGVWETLQAWKRR